MKDPLFPCTIHALFQQASKASVFEHATIEAWVAALRGLPLQAATIIRPRTLVPHVTLFPYGPRVTIDTYHDFADGGQEVHFDRWNCLHLPILLSRAAQKRRIITQWTAVTQHTPHWVSTREELPTYFVDDVQHFLYDDGRWQHVNDDDERLTCERMLARLTHPAVPDPHF